MHGLGFNIGRLANLMYGSVLAAVAQQPLLVKLSFGLFACLYVILACLSYYQTAATTYNSQTDREALLKLVAQLGSGVGIGVGLGCA